MPAAAKRDVSDDALAAEQPTAAKTPSPKRRKKAAPAAEVDGESAATPKAKKKAPAKKRAPKAPSPPPGPLYTQEMRPPRFEGPATRLISWNVAGLRALLKKEPKALATIAESENADIIFLQEHKLQEIHVEDIKSELGLEGWSCEFNCSTAKKGYSGTAVLARSKPLGVTSGIGVAKHDDTGRVMTAELEDMYVVNVYVPNSGAGLKNLEYRTTEWDLDFSDYIKDLEKKKPVVIVGDMNCAHKEIDIHAPKTNLKSAGFTPEERASFEKVYLDAGFVDTFRAQHPEAVAYTYWGYRFGLRAKNKGWRLDYFLVSQALAERCYDSYTMSEVMGSDHCPLGLVVKPGSGK